MFTGDLEIGRRDTAITIDQRERQRLVRGETSQAGLLDRADVNEHIFAAIVTSDEAEALVTVEEFDDTSAFADDLGGHLRPRTTVETATAATIATTEAAATATGAIAAAAARAITTAKATTITAACGTIAATAAAEIATEAAAARSPAAEITAAAATVKVAATTEIVALAAPTIATFAAAAATFTIKTHAPINTRNSVQPDLANHPERTGTRRHESGNTFHAR